jgi:hypothetical protein
MKNDIIPGLPFDEYLQLDLMSKSLLVEMEHSPGHLQWRRKNPKEQSPEMLFGSAVDCYIFDGPEVFDSLYVCRPDGLDLRTKAGKAWAKEHAGREIVPAAVRTCAEAVWGHREASGSLRGGSSQPTVIWQHVDPDVGETGIWLRGRPDYYIVDSTGEHILVDLKTTKSADPQDFGKQAYNMRYHWQAAMYCDGIATVTDSACDAFFFIVAERDPPHRVEVYETPLSILEQGRDEYRAALRAYKRFSDADKWPTTSGQIQTLEFPAWARR